MKARTRLVRKSYEQIAARYAAQRDRFSSLPYLKELLALLPSNPVVLDVGCDAGVPVDRFLVKNGCRVIGIDISKQMIRLARRNVPDAQHKVQDMLQLKARAYEVDAVVSCYAIFHVPRGRHWLLLRRFHSFLKPGGILLITMGSFEWEGSGPFHGTTMWWSHYGPEKNSSLVQSAGFNVLGDSIDNSGGEKHQIILAKINA